MYRFLIIAAFVCAVTAMEYRLMNLPDPFHWTGDSVHNNWKLRQYLRQIEQPELYRQPQLDNFKIRMINHGGIQPDKP